MAATIKMLKPTERTLDKSFPANFLIAAGAALVKKPSAILKNQIIDPIVAGELSTFEGLYESGTYVDSDLPFGVNPRATADIAFCSYMLSEYYKKEKRASRTAERFKYNIQKASNNPIIVASYEFYNLRNTTLDDVDDTITTDQDMMLASILALNSIVVGMRSQGKAAMHPLSRVAATEQNILALADFISDDLRMARFNNIRKTTNINTCVKLYNTACTRKCHQFIGDTQFMCPELACATLISGIMASKNTTSSLINIANSSLKKIAKAAGAIDQELVIDLMSFTTTGSSNLDAQTIFDSYKNRAAVKGLEKIKVAPTSLIAYKRSGINEDEDEEKEGAVGGSKN